MSDNGKWAVYAALVAAVLITLLICIAAYEAGVSSDCHAVSHTASEYTSCMRSTLPGK